MIKVYHANEEITRDSFCYGLDKTYSRATALLNLASGAYSLVAKVDTTDLDVAYAKTNHIDSSWIENDLVTAVGLENRSSHIGDIFEVVSDNLIERISKRSELYVVARMGFDKI